MKATIELDGPRHEIERMIGAMHTELDRMDFEQNWPGIPTAFIAPPIVRRRNTQTTGTITIRFGKGEE